MRTIAAALAVAAVALTGCRPDEPPVAPDPSPEPASEAAAPAGAPPDEQIPFEGLVLTDVRMTTDGEVDLEVQQFTVTGDGLLVDLVAENGGIEDVTLIDQPATVYAVTSLGDEWALEPPAGLPVVVRSGQRADLRLAFRGRLDPNDRWVGVRLGDGERGRAGISATLQASLDAAGTPTDTTAPFAGSTFLQNASTEVAGVDVEVTSVEVTEDAVYLRLTATNRRTEPAQLFGGEDTVALLDSRFRRLPVVLPEDDPEGRLAPGEMATIRLGFRGRLSADADAVSLLLNVDEDARLLTEPGDPLVSATIQNLPLSTGSS